METITKVLEPHLKGERAAAPAAGRDGPRLRAARETVPVLMNERRVMGIWVSSEER